MRVRALQIAVVTVTSLAANKRADAAPDPVAEPEDEASSLPHA